jgi:ABC-type multidrug transport system permease subunit
MKNILAIGHNDLRLFLKRKSSYIWLFLVPLVFIYLMGFAARGPNDPANRHPPLFIENQDTNFLGRLFVDELSAQGLWRVKPEDRDSAAGEIRIPADFTGKILLQTQGKVGFLQPKGASEGDAAIIQLRLLRAVVAMNGHLLEAAPQTNSLLALTEDQLRAVMARPNPVSLEASFAGRHPVPSGFNFSLPGNLVAYLMMNLLIFGGAALAAERRNGVIRRLMSCPTTHGEVVQGKIYGLMLLGIVQVLFFLAVGRFAFHVNLGANLPGVALTLLVFSWVAGSLGVLIGSLMGAEDRVVGICILASLLMAALGGCWWPLEIAPPTQKLIALCLPTGWALQALHQLISFGSGFTAVLKPLAVLLAFGAAANLLAARFFRV